jgi:hypothetical protein
MALTFPVLPGKDARDIANEMKSRPREYEESRRRHGITMERAYLQHTPMGDYVTAYLEAEGDVLEAFGKLASSDLDIDRYMAKAAKEIHGADFTKPMPGPAPETVAAWFDSTATRRGRGMALCAPLAPGATEGKSLRRRRLPPGRVRGITPEAQRERRTAHPPIDAAG